jgi:hypothetical protein
MKNPSTNSPQPALPGNLPYSPLLARWRGIVVLVALLIAAGVSASVVGYRVKSAEWERTRRLHAHYRTLKEKLPADLPMQGRSAAADVPPPQSATPTDVVDRGTLAQNEPDGLSPRDRHFVLMYEINELARVSGLIPVIETASRERLHEAVKAFEAIGAQDAAHILMDTLTALEEGAGSAKAHRIAKRYNRSTARETSVKLFLSIAER